MAKRIYAKIPLTDIKCIEKDLTRIHDKIDTLNKNISNKVNIKYNIIGTGKHDNDTIAYSECPKTVSYDLQDIVYMMLKIEIYIDNMKFKLKFDEYID